MLSCFLVFFFFLAKNDLFEGSSFRVEEILLKYIIRLGASYKMMFETSMVFKESFWLNVTMHLYSKPSIVKLRFRFAIHDAFSAAFV